MMEGTRTLWLFFLLNQMPYCHTDTFQDLSTIQTDSSKTDDQGTSPTPEAKASFNTNDYKNSTNGTYAECLIDTKMGQIAIGSAGVLIVCLLFTTVVLACQICQLQHRVFIPRTSRSNKDLVSGADYWDRPEVTGLVGPCDTNVMLEEVRADIVIKEEEQAVVAGGPTVEEGAKAMVFDLEEKASQMQSSSSRDSCLEVPKDIENMPLVV